MNELIDLHRSYSHQIYSAIQRNDDDAVDQLDKLLVETQNDILQMPMENNQVMLEQVQWMLNVLVPETDRTIGESKLCQNLFEKLSGYLQDTSIKQ